MMDVRSFLPDGDEQSVEDDLFKEIQRVVRYDLSGVDGERKKIVFIRKLAEEIERLENE